MKQERGVGGRKGSEREMEGILVRANLTLKSKRHPAIWWEVLQQWYQELKTAIPVAQEQHHANEVKNSHHSTGKIICHVENLLTKIKSILIINFF